MPQRPEVPSRKTYYHALACITDYSWTPVRALTDKETASHPTYMTPAESEIVFMITSVMPRRWIPAIVRQWAGQDGEQALLEHINATMRTLQGESS